MNTSAVEDKPRVEIFGDNMNYAHDRHDDDGGTVWGVALLFGGSMLLLNTLKMVPWTVWDHVWSFWPALLVLMGFQIIMGNTRLSRLLLFLVSIFAFGMVTIYALQMVGSPLVSDVVFPKEIDQLLLMMKGVKP